MEPNTVQDKRDLEQVAWMFFAALRRISRHMDVRSHDLEREFGLTSSQLNVLWAVSSSDGMAIGKIAQMVSLSNATLSAMADRLEEHGLVTRSRSVSDKRQVLIALTDSGREVLRLRPLPFHDCFLERLREMEGWQRTQLLATVQRLDALMEPQHEPHKSIS